MRAAVLADYRLHRRVNRLGRMSWVMVDDSDFGFEERIVWSCDPSSDGTEQNRTATCMVLKAKAIDRRKNLALSRDEFCRP
ncbi:hypothetical protein TNCV_2616001 [Trichonephila clavipes]|nr:hypothetical protein TNCV_2616001 [Trichonephila clavipes]